MEEPEDGSGGGEVWNICFYRLHWQPIGGGEDRRSGQKHTLRFTATTPMRCVCMRVFLLCVCVCLTRMQGCPVGQRAGFPTEGNSLLQLLLQDDLAQVGLDLEADPISV